MPITYFYDSKYKKPYPGVEKSQKRKIILSADGHVDLTAAGLDYTLSYAVPNWVAHEVLLHYGAATARSYSINKVIGRGIITNLNDLLWISCKNSGPQTIVLSQGFYTGTQLATELKTQMDANAAFVSSGAAPVTVSYSAVTGKFTITAAGTETIQYFVTNTSIGVNRNSTAASVIGFNANSALANSIVGDTVVAGLGNKIPIDADAVNTDTNTIINLDSLSPYFDVDEALNITISAVATTVDYKISYEEAF